MKNLIVAIIILTFSFSYSQTNKKRFISNSIDSFKTGEWLQFRVHYGFFNASEIEIKRNPNSRSAKLRVIKKIKNPNIKINRKDLNMEQYFLLEEMYV